MKHWDDIPEAIRLWLQNRFAGQRIYIPKPTPGVDRQSRDDAIRKQHEANRVAGMSCKQSWIAIARRHGLSTTQVRRILEPGHPGGAARAHDGTPHPRCASGMDRVGEDDASPDAQDGWP